MLEGYTDQVSVLPGGEVDLMVSTVAPSFRVVAFRLGGYEEGSGRRVWTSDEVEGTMQAEPTVSADTHTVVAGLGAVAVGFDGRMGAWAVCVQVDRRRRGAGTRPLVVRSESAEGKVALVAPAATWQAYNDLGRIQPVHRA